MARLERAPASKNETVHLILRKSDAIMIRDHLKEPIDQPANSEKITKNSDIDRDHCRSSTTIQ